MNYLSGYYLQTSVLLKTWNYCQLTIEIYQIQLHGLQSQQPILSFDHSGSIKIAYSPVWLLPRKDFDQLCCSTLSIGEWIICCPTPTMSNDAVHCTLVRRQYPESICLMINWIAGTISVRLRISDQWIPTIWKTSLFSFKPLRKYTSSAFHVHHTRLKNF